MDWDHEGKEIAIIRINDRMTDVTYTEDILTNRIVPHTDTSMSSRW